MNRKYGRQINAYCYANGVIKFRSAKQSVPDGAILIVSGPGKVIRNQITAVARHGYDHKTLLVPGVPEAENQKERVEALINWCKWWIPFMSVDIAKAKAGTLEL